MAEPKGLADLVAQSGQWEKVKTALNKAVGTGIGNWILGQGSPERVFNPFQALTQPGATYSPANYQGVGKMGQRLRMTEDENSPPMQALKTTVTKNPMLKDVEIAVGRRRGDPASATGSIQFRDAQAPRVVIAPVVSPTTDPGVTLVHEMVGHGSHGQVRGDTLENDRDFISPVREGIASGTEKGIYKDLWPGNAYDAIYGNRPKFRQAQEAGVGLAQQILKSGEVPPQMEVVDIFRGRNPWSVKAPPVGGS